MLLSLRPGAGVGCFGKFSVGDRPTDVPADTSVRVVAIIVAGCLVLLFLFVPETFWDRTPRPRARSKRPALYRSVSSFRGRRPEPRPDPASESGPTAEKHAEPSATRARKDVRVGFAGDNLDEKDGESVNGRPGDSQEHGDAGAVEEKIDSAESPIETQPQVAQPVPVMVPPEGDTPDLENGRPGPRSPIRSESEEYIPTLSPSVAYTENLRQKPPVPWVHTLRVWNGRLASDKWLRILLRPLILFAYPSVLWSSLVYSLSVGWLIVLSEAVAHIYQDRNTYNFSQLGTGLVYISPFVGGILGTAVAGRVSDMVVRFMSRRNGGVYEPEFRLVMAIPIALCTAAGLMGFGWSAEERNAWIVPTIFFGIVSFGCCLGSTTSITFCVDSYRQYAGEALVTLNFSKSKFHLLLVCYILFFSL